MNSPLSSFTAQLKPASIGLVSSLSSWPYSGGNVYGGTKAFLNRWTVSLAAESAGLGSCAISALRNHPQEVAEILELPDKVFPVAGLCLGYPAAEVVGDGCGGDGR